MAELNEHLSRKKLEHENPEIGVKSDREENSEIGKDFLFGNKSLEGLELPQLERVGGEFSLDEEAVKKLESINSEILKDNNENPGIKGKITSRIIAFLDKITGLTKSEIDFVARKLERGNGKERETEDRDSR